MLKKISAVSALLLLSGCSVFSQKPVEPRIVTVTKVVPLEIYQPPLPQEIALENVKFFVITKSNLEEQIAKIEKMLGGDLVVFALTPQAYENMAYNLQEIRRYVNQSKELILYYREATSSDKGTTSKDWLEKNEKKTQDQLKNN